MEEALSRGPYLAGSAYSLAECAVIPYLLRLELLRLNALWDRHAGVGDWWQRMRARLDPNVHFRAHDRGRLGPVQESAIRPVA
jgi:glutathione S-transferase